MRRAVWPPACCPSWRDKWRAKNAVGLACCFSSILVLVLVGLLFSCVPRVICACFVPVFLLALTLTISEISLFGMGFLRLLSVCTAKMHFCCCRRGKMIAFPKCCHHLPSLLRYVLEPTFGLNLQLSAVQAMSSLASFNGRSQWPVHCCVTV